MGAFGITDAEFAAWLEADARPRCLLVEVVAYDDALPGTETRYLSNMPFATRPIDTPANTIYEDLIVEAPAFETRIDEALGGRSRSAYGDIVVANVGGALDAWLADGWDGRAVRVLIGSPDWHRPDFRVVLLGTVADIDAPGRDTLALKIRDRTHLFDVPVQTSLVGGSTVNADRPKPLAFGPCFNIEPVLIDAATHTYQVHDGAIDAIVAVRDNGVAVANTPNLAAGTFTLSSAPAGRITADVRGAKPSGTYLTTAADIVEHLATTRGGLSAADIDTTAFVAFETASPQPLGLYIRERRNLIDAIDDLITSVGGWWAFGRDGRLRAGRLDAPFGSPVLSIGADEVEFDSASIRVRELPVASVRLGHTRNWTLQDPDALAGAVSEANRALYAAASTVANATNSVATKHLQAPNPDIAETLLTSASDAATEATRRAALRNVVRTVVSLTTFVRPLTLELGDVVELTHPRFGFESGELAVVVGLRERLLDNRVELELWK